MPGEQPYALGQRIAVWGVTGSGKTTLARGLAAALGLPVVELDGIRHARGWDSTDYPEFRVQLTETLDAYNDGWVVEGSYRAIHDVYLPRIDTMIWIDLPWRTSFWRLLRRTMGRAITKEPLYNPDGPRESWRLSFLSRKSILWWSISTHRRAKRERRNRIAELPAHVRVYKLQTPEEVAALLSAAKASAAGGRTGNSSLVSQ